MLLTVAPVYLDSLYHLCNLHFCLSFDWLPIHACDLVTCRQSPFQSCGRVVEDLQNSRDNNWKGTKVLLVLPKQVSSLLHSLCKKKNILKASSLGIKNKLWDTYNNRMEFADAVALPGQCTDTGSTGPLHQCWFLWGCSHLSSGKQCPAPLVYHCWQQDIVIWQI